MELLKQANGKVYCKTLIDGLFYLALLAVKKSPKSETAKYSFEKQYMETHHSCEGICIYNPTSERLSRIHIFQRRGNSVLKGATI